MDFLRWVLNFCLYGLEVFDDAVSEWNGIVCWLSFGEFSRPCLT